MCGESSGFARRGTCPTKFRLRGRIIHFSLPAFPVHAKMVATKMKNFAHLLVVALLMLGPVVFVKAQAHSDEKPLDIRTVPGDSFDLGGRAIVVPAPQGFANGLGRFEKFSMVMNATEGPNLDILAAHAPVSKTEELMRGSVSLDLYTKVSVLKSLRTMDVTPENFATVVAEVEKNFTSFIDPNGPTIKGAVASANAKLKEQTGEEAGLDLSQPKSLGFFDKQPQIFSAMVMMNVAVNGGHKTMLSSLSYLLINKRLVYAYVFKELTSEEDVKTLQVFTRKWTSAIVAANK